MGRVADAFAAWYAPIREDIFKFCEALHFKPTFQQQELLLNIQKGVFGQGPPLIAAKSGQGCLHGNSEVFVDGVGRTTISEMARTAGGRIASMDEESRRISLNDATAFYSGHKECLRVYLDSGQWIDLTGDHRVYGPKGWVEAKDLRPGDLVATPRRLPAPKTPLIVPDHEVILAAYLASDGSTTCSVRFTNMPGPVLDEFVHCVGKAGGSVRVSPTPSKAMDAACSGLVPLVRRLGLYGCNARTKRVPASYYMLEDDQVALFLNRFWACDGYVTGNVIGTTLASEGLIRDLQTMLLRLGVLSRTSHRKAAYVKNGERHEFDAWRLTISGKSNIETFLQKVGPILGKVDACAKIRAAHAGKVENSNTDIVPLKVAEMSSVIRELGIVQQRGRRAPVGRTLAEVRARCRGRPYAFVSRRKFARFVEEFGYRGEYAHLASNDLHWAKVVSSTPIEAHDVYDATVPAAGTFVAQNVVVHNCGKTTATGVGALWLCFRNEGAMIPVTAPTMKQCQGAWREELERTLSKADPWFKKIVTVTRTRVFLAGNHKWGIRFITASKPEAAQGLHEENMSIFVDEASGVDSALIEQWVGTMSNTGSPGNRPVLVLTGNPNARDTFFFRCFNDLRDRFATQTMNAEESPICSKDRNAIVAELYGLDSDAYRVRVLGEFPNVDPQSVMSSEDVEACSRNSMVACAGLSRARQFGIDLARFGGDESAIYRRSGLAIVGHWIGVKVEPGHVIDKAFAMQAAAGWKNDECVFVPDASGMGQGVLHKFYDGRRRVFEFHNGSSATVPEYENKITQAYFEMAKLVRKRVIYLPKDNRLVQQLSTRKYFTTKKGKLMLESKDDYVKRGFDSPDRADACVQAFWENTLANSQVATSGPSGRRVGAGSIIK